MLGFTRSWEWTVEGIRQTAYWVTLSAATARRDFLGAVSRSWSLWPFDAGFTPEQSPNIYLGASREAARARALTEHGDDCELVAADPHDLADRVNVGEQRHPRAVPEHDHLPSMVDFSGREERL